MRILMVGDVIGRPGRRGVAAILPALRSELDIDLVIAYGENAAGGLGLTPATALELFEAGVDILTSGNHIWEHKEIIPYLDGDLPILRPLNYPPEVPGRGHLAKRGALVVSLMGRTFMGPYDCPFRSIDQLLLEIGDGAKVIVVDFHAEATSEKMAMGCYLDGRVGAVLGTHTHVGTVDARLLPGGAAYISDVGMTGPRDSVIGYEVEPVLQRFLTQTPHRFSVGKGVLSFNSVLVEIDEGSGHALSIERIDRELEDYEG